MLVEVQFGCLVGGAGDKSFSYRGRDVECGHVDFILCGRDVVTMSNLENLSSLPHLSLSGGGMSSEDILHSDHVKA